jgi:hypothetical protein
MQRNKTQTFFGLMGVTNLWYKSASNKHDSNWAPNVSKHRYLKQVCIFTRNCKLRVMGESIVRWFIFYILKSLDHMLTKDHTIINYYQIINPNGRPPCRYPKHVIGQNFMWKFEDFNVKWKNDKKWWQSWHLI